MLGTEVKASEHRLSFDEEGVALLARYPDELSAHRAKKNWAAIFVDYFLLEPERDYNIWVDGSAGLGYFTTTCAFTSACGRYSFWRLINRQAPEAEAELLMASQVSPNEERPSNRLGRSDLRATHHEQLLSELERQIRETKSTTKLISKLMSFFK